MNLVCNLNQKLDFIRRVAKCER